MKIKQFIECAIVYSNALCSADGTVINILFFALYLSPTGDDFI